MQCACALLSSVAYPALQRFSILSHKWYDLEKKKLIEHKMFALIISTILSERIIKRDNDRNV